jgi:hypothetical protein
MANEPDVLAPLRRALRDLIAWWTAEKVDGLIIGGVAAALLGRPRVTRGVDGLVWLDEASWHTFLAASQRFGFSPRTPDPLQLAHEARVLLLTHVASHIDIDIAFASLPFERQALDRAVYIDVVGARLPLPTPEDLIVMKAIAHRPRDLADIEGLLDAFPRLNRRHVRKYLTEFAELLDMPELRTDFDALLTKRRRPRKKGPWTVSRDAAFSGGRTARVGSAPEQVQGLVITRAVVVPVEQLVEDRARRRHTGEQRRRGAQLHVVGRAKDLTRGSVLQGERGLGALAQAGAKHRMIEVGAGLVDILDRIQLGR